MANTKEAKRKEILVVNGKIHVKYAHTDKVDILDPTELPGASDDFHRTLVECGLRHSLGDAFDTYKIEGDHATPEQKRGRLLEKWDAFKSGNMKLKSSKAPAETREERIERIANQVMSEGIPEAQAVNIATKLVEAGVK